MDIILNKVKSLLKLSGSDNDTTTESGNEKEIDLQKLFSSQGIDILPVIKKILNNNLNFIIKINFQNQSIFYLIY